MTRAVPYPSPGEILNFEFLQPMGITAADLAREMGVPLPVIEQILAGADLPQAPTPSGRCAPCAGLFAQSKTQ